MKHVKSYENLKSLDITEGWNFAFSLLVRSYVRFKSNFKRTLVPYFFVIIALPHCLGMSYYVNFLGVLGSNDFHIK